MRRGANSTKSGTLRRGQAPSLHYLNRHFSFEGNSPALRVKIVFLRVGNGRTVPKNTALSIRHIFTHTKGDTHTVGKGFTRGNIFL